MRRVLLLLLVAALAGCSDSDDSTSSGEGADEPEAPGPETPAPTSPPSQTPTDPGAAPQTNASAPTPEISLAVAKTTVFVGAEVTFNLTGTDGASWTLDVDGDGTSDGDGSTLPASFVHAYQTAGAFNATAIITEGSQSANDTVLIEVLEETIPEPSGFEPVHLELEYAYGCLHCYPPYVGLGAIGDHCVGLNAGSNNQDCAWVAVDPAWVGRDFTSAAPADADVAFYTECSPGNQIGAVGADGHDAGTIPPGTGCLVTWNWDTDLGGTVTIDIV